MSAKAAVIRILGWAWRIWFRWLQSFMLAKLVKDPAPHTGNSLEGDRVSERHDSWLPICICTCRPRIWLSISIYFYTNRVFKVNFKVTCPNCKSKKREDPMIFQKEYIGFGSRGETATHTKVWSKVTCIWKTDRETSCIKALGSKRLRRKNTGKKSKKGIKIRGAEGNSKVNNTHQRGASESPK